MPRLHNSMALQQLSLVGILLSQTFPNSIYCRRHDPIPLKTISKNFKSVESMLRQRMMDEDMCTCIMYCCFLAPLTQPLDLAQLVEHTTVTVTQRLYGRWFDSGSREVQHFFHPGNTLLPIPIRTSVSSFFCMNFIFSLGSYRTHSGAQ